jgi:acyl carrier protein
MPPIGLFRNILKAIDEGKPLNNVRIIILGGDDLFKQDINQYRNRFNTGTELFYRLAGSETMLMREYKINPSMNFSTEKIPVGFSVPDKELILLDDHGNIVADNLVGEIAIRSRYLALGYWRNPELTTRKFLPDPKERHKRIYLTGDIGRINESGQLEFLGRKDHMVKIRGFSVQLEIIDRVLQSVKGMQDAVVAVRDNNTKGKYLVAYLVPEKGIKIPEKTIRDAISKKLPSYMNPSIYVWMDHLPRTATGKVDRNNLPVPSGTRPNLETAYKPAGTDIEKNIESIWRKILELDEVGVNDNFFELGGDSLMVLEMTLDVEKVFSRSVPQSFFKTPTVSHLAELLTDDTREGKESDQFVLESFRKNSESQDDQYARYSKKRKWLSREYSLKDLDLLLDMIVGHYLVRKPYLEAQEWALKWSQNRRVQRILYQRRAVLFSRWLTLLELEQPHSSDIFGMSIFANLWNRMPRPWKNNRDPKKEMQKYLQSRYPYWRTLGEMIEAVPYGELSEQFPMRGLENLMSAYQKGRGVILVSFHGMPRASGFIPLQRVLRIDDIPTISYLIPIRQSRYQGKRDQMSASTAATLNAEIAMFGQRRLLDGGLIHFVSDRSDTMGRTYKVDIGNRIYEVKGGFAELALNTGASVIPFVRYYLPEGRVQMEFNAPLDLGEGERYERVEGMVREYGAFIERSRKAHPEAMSWNWLKGYLALSIR